MLRSPLLDSSVSLSVLQVNVAGRNFFAFSHFTGKGSHWRDSESQCDQTFPGWHNDAKNPDAKRWGCYTGHKANQVTLARQLLSRRRVAVADTCRLVRIPVYTRSTGPYSRMMSSPPTTLCTSSSPTTLCCRHRHSLSSPPEPSVNPLQPKTANSSRNMS